MWPFETPPKGKNVRFESAGGGDPVDYDKYQTSTEVRRGSGPLKEHRDMSLENIQSAIAEILTRKCGVDHAVAVVLAGGYGVEKEFSEEERALINRLAPPSQTFDFSAEGIERLTHALMIQHGVPDDIALLFSKYDPRIVRKEEIDDKKGVEDQKKLRAYIESIGRNES